MITYPVGDLLTRIRNAGLARKREVVAPYSNLKYKMAIVLKKEGYLSEVKKVKGNLVINLTFKRRRPVITGVKNISRPGLRVYKKTTDIPSPLRGDGIAVISTPEGIMSGKEARKKKLGGELLGEVW
tara:strand:+ start:131 stop:511 length:381 start_codon:yes stop_codon:yes gene_type:complete